MTAQVNLKPSDYIHKSKAGFFHVWELKNSYGIYTNSGRQIARVNGKGPNDKERAILIADAMDALPAYS